LIYLISITVFSSIILALVSLLLLVESRVVKKGLRRITINDDDEKSIDSRTGATLLSALVSKDIFLIFCQRSSPTFPARKKRIKCGFPASSRSGKTFA